MTNLSKKNVFQCPICDKDNLKAWFAGHYDMDGQGAWDETTKDRDMRMVEGSELFCKNCNYTGSQEAFSGKAKVYTVSRLAWPITKHRLLKNVLVEVSTDASPIQIVGAVRRALRERDNEVDRVLTKCQGIRKTDQCIHVALPDSGLPLFILENKYVPHRLCQICGHIQKAGAKSDICPVCREKDGWTPYRGMQGKLSKPTASKFLVHTLQISNQSSPYCSLPFRWRVDGHLKNSVISVPAQADVIELINNVNEVVRRFLSCKPMIGPEVHYSSSAHNNDSITFTEFATAKPLFKLE